VVLEKYFLHLFFSVHVPNKIWVQEVGTQTNRAIAISTTPSPKKTMGKENKYDGAGDPIKMFL
jgi:hypothetical protein